MYPNSESPFKWHQLGRYESCPGRRPKDQQHFESLERHCQDSENAEHGKEKPVLLWTVQISLWGLEQLRLTFKVIKVWLYLSYDVTIDMKILIKILIVPFYFLIQLYEQSQNKSLFEMVKFHETFWRTKVVDFFQQTIKI